MDMDNIKGNEIYKYLINWIEVIDKESLLSYIDYDKILYDLLKGGQLEYKQIEGKNDLMNSSNEFDKKQIKNCIFREVY